MTDAERIAEIRAWATNVDVMWLLTRLEASREQNREMREAQTASGNFATGDGVCPFCGEKDFDVVGLGIHLKTGHCEPYNVSVVLAKYPEKEGE